MPLALSVGVLAGLLTYFAVATSSALHIVVWVSFIAWAVFSLQVQTKTVC